MNEIIIGIDECARGPVFGPMIVAACACPIGWRLDGVRDSKKISSEARRAELSAKIKAACPWTLRQINVEAINKYGTLKSLKYAGEQCMKELVGRVQTACPGMKIRVIFDGRDHKSRSEEGYTIESMEKADALIFEVSCASIIAKAHHDEWINRHADDPTYSRFNLRTHRGYPTVAHKSLLQEFGLSALHRKVACQTLLKEKDNATRKTPASTGLETAALFVTKAT